MPSELDININVIYFLFEIIKFYEYIMHYVYILQKKWSNLFYWKIYIYILVIWLFSDHTLSMTTQKICVADVAKKLLQAIRKRFEFDKHTINWTLWIGNGILRKQMLKKRCLLEKEVMGIFTAKDVSDNSKNYLIDTSQICI